MTTARENLLKVFRHEEPDWVPIVVFADNYNATTGMPPSFYEDEVGIGRVLAIQRYFDVDELDRGPAGAFTTHYREVGYTNSVDGDIRTEKWETPFGDLVHRSKRVEFPGRTDGEHVPVSWGPFEWPVKSMKDFPAFKYVFENIEYQFHPDVVAERMHEVGERGMVTMHAPASPLGNCVRLYTGVERLAIAYYDHHTELCDLLETMADKYYEFYRGLAQLTVDATIGYDDTTTNAITPTMFRELEIPYLNRIADILHAQGKFCIHHACGHVLHLMEDFGTTRIDGLDGPAPPPVGNTTVAQARERMGDSIVLMPMSDWPALETGDPGAIRGYVRRTFEQAGSRKNLVMRISPPPATPVAHLWLAVDEAKKLSRR